MAAQWSAVRSRLVQHLPTLTHWDADTVQVFAGAAFEASKVTFASVGHANDGMNTTAGSFTTALAADGFRYIEQGTVACQITTTAGNGDLEGIEAVIFPMLDDVDEWIRADRTIGVLSPEGYASLSVDLSSIQGATGASGTAVFTVDYYTVT